MFFIMIGRLKLKQLLHLCFNLPICFFYKKQINLALNGYNTKFSMKNNTNKTSELAEPLQMAKNKLGNISNCKID